MAFKLNGGIFFEESDELHLEQLYGMFLFLVERGSTFPFTMHIPFNLETFGGGRLRTFEAKSNWPLKLFFPPKPPTTPFAYLGSSTFLDSGAHGTPLPCSKMVASWEITYLMSLPTCKKTHFLWAVSAYVA